jgi:hypothetical protein
LTQERARLIGQRSALLAKMRAIAKDVRGDDPTRRVHLIVSIDRFLQRLLATTDWGTWVLKGGYANQLRHPDEARFTEDVDLNIDADIDSATDMVWYTTRHAFRSQALIDAGLATFSRRGEHPWPPIPAAPPTAWARQYAALRREMALEPPTAAEAYEVLMAFLVPVLAGDHTQRWGPTTHTWSKIAARGRHGAGPARRGRPSPLDWIIPLALSPHQKRYPDPALSRARISRFIWRMNAARVCVRCTI